MSIAFDAGAGNVRTLTGNPHTWNLTPVGTPRLIVVMAAHGTSSTDHWTGAVTYGGVAMTRVPTNGLAQDTAGEPGAAVMYYLGSGIPTGVQAVSMTLGSSTTDDIHAFAFSFTAAGDCYVVSSGRVQADTANPQVTLSAFGIHSTACGVYYSGGLIAASTPLTGNTEHGPNNDAGGTWSVCFSRTTTPDTADKTVGWTAVSDDAALVAALFAEVDNKLATPSTLSLVTSTFAPVIKLVVIPSTASLALTTFAPTVTASDHKTVTPTTLALTTSAFAPVTALGIIPGTAALTLTTFAPTVTASDHQTVTPTTVALAVTTFAPTVTAASSQTVTPTTASLTVSAFAPTVTASDHKTVTPDVLALSLTAFAPTVTASDHKVVTPGTVALSMTAFAPDTVISDHKVVIPETASLALTAFASSVAIGLPIDISSAVALLAAAPMPMGTLMGAPLPVARIIPQGIPTATLTTAAHPSAGLTSAPLPHVTEVV